MTRHVIIQNSLILFCRDAFYALTVTQNVRHAMPKDVCSIFMLIFHLLVSTTIPLEVLTCRCLLLSSVLHFGVSFNMEVHVFLALSHFALSHAQ